MVRTLAATIGGDLLDYASVATDDGERCRPGPQPVVAPVPGSAQIGQRSLLGVSLGMTPLEVLSLPQWREIDAGAARDCRAFEAGSSARAFVADDVVTGLSADAVASGPAVGQTVDEAVAALADAAAGVEVTLPTSGLGEVVLDAADGRTFILTAFAPLVTPEGLDLRVPSEVSVGGMVVHSVVLGSTCGYVS